MTREQINLLERLAALRANGALSESEFDLQKREVMGAPAIGLTTPTHDQCAFCGGTMSKFSMVCRHCGRVFDKSGVSSPIVDFVARLRVIDLEIAQAEQIGDPVVRMNRRNALSQSKAELIRRQPIPADRESMLDFLALAIGNIGSGPRLNRGGSPGLFDPSQKAFLGLAEQSLVRVELLGPADPEARRLTESARKSIARYAQESKRHMWLMVGLVVAGLLLMCMILGVIALSQWTKSR